jgi:FSR family fosmidomycin resistance protein-like MFS transporter
LQPLLALAVDRRQWYRQAAATGCALTAVAMLVPGSLPILAVCVAGAGNAMFHLGGGSVGLRLKPGFAAPASIFVAPGAAGLFLGTLLGESGFSALWTGALLLDMFSVLLLVHEAQPRDRPQHPLGRRRLILPLLLGLAFSFPWTSSSAPAALMVLAGALGKGLGGVLADRFGWLRFRIRCHESLPLPLA